jgi:hypothetical protein
MPINERTTLGPMVAAACLQQLRIHTEELAGRAPVLGAGRLRGLGLVADLGLAGSNLDDAKLHQLFLETFGIDGTRLCLVTEVVSDGSGGYVVQLVEGACTRGLQADEPMCAYTLGVFVGALQGITGVTMQGVESQCQAMGAPTCVYEVRPHVVLG